MIGYFNLNNIDADEKEQLSKEFYLDKPVRILGRIKYNFLNDSLLAVAHKTHESIEAIRYEKLSDALQDAELPYVSHNGKTLIETGLSLEIAGENGVWLDIKDITFSESPTDFKSQLVNVND